MSDENYGVSGDKVSKEMEAPSLDHLPKKPKNYQPKIGLIGAGNIASYHLDAYRQLGLNVVAICDINREQAEKRKAEFFPDAQVYENYQDLLADSSIEVVTGASTSLRTSASSSRRA